MECCLDALKDLAFRLVNRYYMDKDCKNVNILLQSIGVQLLVNEIGEMMVNLIILYLDSSDDQMWDTVHKYRDSIDDLVNSYNNGEVLIDTYSILDKDNIMSPIKVIDAEIIEKETNDGEDEV